MIGIDKENIFIPFAHKIVGNFLQNRDRFAKTMHVYNYATLTVYVVHDGYEDF